MGERIFFSKLRKVLASWLLCIKFENARLVIFQIGYGPSHLISMLAVSRSLSPRAKFLLAGARYYCSDCVCNCARQLRRWGSGKKEFQPHTHTHSSALPPLFLPTAHGFQQRRPLRPHSGLTWFETGQMKRQPNTYDDGYPFRNHHSDLPWVLG